MEWTRRMGSQRCLYSIRQLRSLRISPPIPKNAKKSEEMLAALKLFLQKDGKLERKDMRTSIYE